MVVKMAINKNNSLMMPSSEERDQHCEFEQMAAAYSLLSSWAGKLMKLNEEDLFAYSCEIVSLTLATPQIILKKIHHDLQKASIYVDLDQLNHQLDLFKRDAYSQQMVMYRAP
jgi:hypothetical protein